MWILHAEDESVETPAGRVFIFETKEVALLKALVFMGAVGPASLQSADI
jgi:hypothetical protein